MSHYIGGISHYHPGIPPRYPSSREIQAARSNFAGENHGASFSRRIRVCSIKMQSLVFGPRIDIAAWPEGMASVKRLTPSADANGGRGACAPSGQGGLDRGLNGGSYRDPCP